MQSSSKMGLLEGVSVLVDTNIDVFFEKINQKVLDGHWPIHLHREKVGWWIFGYYRYTALLRKFKKPAKKLKIKIGPVTTRSLPKLIMKVGVVRER